MGSRKLHMIILPVELLNVILVCTSWFSPERAFGSNRTTHMGQRLFPRQLFLWGLLAGCELTPLPLGLQNEACLVLLTSYNH